MTFDDYTAFCAGLPGSTHVQQWGGAHVWKVGGKVYAIGVWDGAAPAITFKTTPIGFEMLKEQPGLRPAPYLASRGMTWIQHYAAPGLSDAELTEHIRASYTLVAQGLTRKARAEAGLPPAPSKPPRGIRRKIRPPPV